MIFSCELHPQRNPSSPGHTSSVLLTCLKACGGSLSNLAGKSHHNWGRTGILLSAPCGEPERAAPIARRWKDILERTAVAARLSDGSSLTSGKSFMPHAWCSQEHWKPLTEQILLQSWYKSNRSCLSNAITVCAQVSPFSYSFFNPPLHCGLF